MKNEKTVEVLNALITLNNDRMEDYATASKETEDVDLKAMFAKFSTTSEKCKLELVNEVVKLDGKIAEGTSISGKFFRGWMDIRAAFSGNDYKTILSSCEHGEDLIVDAYERALNDDSKYLTYEQETIIDGQYNMLMDDHDTVKSMRDTLMEA